MDISDLRQNRSSGSLQSFLMSTYRMSFETSDEMEAGIPEKELSNLADEISNKKAGVQSNSPKRVLAVNDALQVLRIYERRRRDGDNSPNNPFGHSIWWLTQESTVIRETGSIVSKNDGARFLMRPEFLLTYVSYAPKMRQICENFRSFFPSKLGVRLSYRAKQEVFDKTVKEAMVYAHTNEARARYTVRKMTNELKSSNFGEADFEPVR